MKKILNILKPGLIAVMSLLIVSAFLRYYLYVNANQLVSEFKNQNYKEIYSLDTLKISSRLNSLSAVINWVCIEGSVAEKTFYQMEKGQCETGIFKHKALIVTPEANNFRIAFTLRLPKEVEWLFLIFLALQALVILAIFISTKLHEQFRMKSEMNISKLARQMSHDIRSPLAALNTTLSSCQGINEEEKLIIEKAIFRINEISNSLLKNTKKSEDIFDLAKPPILISAKIFKLIEEVVEEKKVQHNKNVNISINLVCFNKNLEALIDTSNFQRIISNLINNSIEAASNGKSLEVSIIIKEQNLNIEILINDNGHGIPKVILDKLGKSEATTKKDGNGLGLFHAFESVQSWGGSLTIHSNEYQGTEISILLPKAIKETELIVLLEDDNLIRTVWESSARIHNVNLKTFENKNDLIQSLDHISKNSIFYIDSELGNSEKGEDVAILLNKLGFKQIFMASGYDKDKFNQMTFLKGVVGKSPPWKKIKVVLN